jgi:transposase
MKPSYDDLLKIIEDQQRTIARLEKKIAELEERLNLNSKNSSKPPSSDQKKNKQAPKGGAVKGHRGHNRKLYPLDQVSKRVISSLSGCNHCGCKKLRKKTPQIFQQVEISQITPLVTQIELEKALCCGCGKNLVASFPKEYDCSSFGPRLISFIGASSSVYRMSKRTIQTEV